MILIIDFYLKHSILLPKKGGTYIEGQVSNIECFNPVFCDRNDADKDVNRLVFSGLWKFNPVKHKVFFDLAESWELKEDNLTYIVYLRKDALWHDGQPFTADDVVFTYRDVIQNPSYNGPYKSDVSNIEIEKIDDYTVVFKLKKPAAFFLKSLTIGLLPKHIFTDNDISKLTKAAFNWAPIGTGPYTLEKFDQTTNQVTLQVFPDYYWPQPFIKNIILQAFPSFFTALEKSNELNALRTIPDQYQTAVDKLDNFQTHEVHLPQYVALILNTDKTHLKDLQIRQAFSLGIDRQKLADKIDNVYIIDSPVFCNIEKTSIEYNPDKARSLIEGREYFLNQEDFYTKNFINEENNDEEKELKIELYTLENENFIKAADLIQAELGQIWIKVNIHTKEISLLQNVIKNREYDALVFGLNLGTDLDMFSYLHSSQATTSGYNLSQYNSFEADYLIKTIREDSSGEKHGELLLELETLVLHDVPLIPFYTPKIHLATDNTIKNVSFQEMYTLEDRFEYLKTAYVKTSRSLGGQGVKSLLKDLFEYFKW